MRLIDAQIHLWEGPGAPPHHHRAPFTIETAIAQMDAAGIDRAVICPALWDPGANEYAARAEALHPDRFVTMPWFRLDAPDAPDLMATALARPGVKGLRFVVVDPDEVRRIRAGDLDWLWVAASDRNVPIALMVLPDDLTLFADLAQRFPDLRLMVDHLGVLPWLRLPEAVSHLDSLTALARHPNVAVKASGVPSMATDDFPFASTHPVLEQLFTAFGPQRFFWGTDITRLSCDWSEAVSMFVGHLPWMTGRDLELVMGEALADWIGWP